MSETAMSDPDVEIMLSISGGGISRDKMLVNVSEKFNRRILPESFEKDIERIWRERQAKNPKLWNGSKFRLASAVQTNDTVTLDLGITGYKDFIGTNWSPRANELLQLGLEKKQNSQTFMSDALGVGSIVETNDHFFILIRRTEECGEAVGLLDIPGGHPEPQVLT